MSSEAGVLGWGQGEPFPCAFSSYDCMCSMFLMLSTEYCQLPIHLSAFQGVVLLVSPAKDAWQSKEGGGPLCLPAQFPHERGQTSRCGCVRDRRTLGGAAVQFPQLSRSPLTKHSSYHGNHCSALHGGHGSPLQMPPAAATRPPPPSTP